MLGRPSEDDGSSYNSGSCDTSATTGTPGTVSVCMGGGGMYAWSVLVSQSL